MAHSKSETVKQSSLATLDFCLVLSVDEYDNSYNKNNGTDKLRLARHTSGSHVG